MSLISIIKALRTELSGMSDTIEYENLKEKRLVVCRTCPLYKRSTLIGYSIYKCDDNSFVEHPIKVINENNQLVDSIERIYGCGCTLENNSSPLPEKTVLVGGETCPRRLWDKVEVDLFYIHELTQEYIEKTPNMTKASILASIDLLGIVNYCNANKFTLALKPNLMELQTRSDLEIQTDSIFNIVSLKRSNSEIEYVKYGDLITV